MAASRVRVAAPKDFMLDGWDDQDRINLGLEEGVLKFIFYSRRECCRA